LLVSIRELGWRNLVGFRGGGGGGDDDAVRFARMKTRKSLAGRIREVGEG